MAGTIVQIPASQVPQGNAAGVVIDGVVYQLAGEPPTAKPGNWLKLH
jgi:hypothetical protein